MNYSDDEGIQSMLSGLPFDQLENESVAEAFATIDQHRQGFKKKTFGRKPSGSIAPSSPTLCHARLLATSTSTLTGGPRTLLAEGPLVGDPESSALKVREK